MRILSLAALLLCSQSALADWHLDKPASSLNFVTTKNSLVTETHSFKQFDGMLSEAGKLEISIDLLSLETNIPIRNERMQEHLFKLFPKAKLTAQIQRQWRDLDVGESQRIELTGSLELNTKTQEVPMLVQVTRLANQQLLATTVAPVMVNAVQFGLTDGIKKLQEIAGLSSIDQTVPVTFNVIFNGN